MKKVGIFGGSNSIIQHSYSNVFRSYKDLQINNYGLGNTSSLMSIRKSENIKNNDIILFEYFQNDNNHYFQNKHKPELVRKTLLEFIKKTSGKQLIFILIYRYYDIEPYKTSPVFKIYKDIINKYNIPYVSSYDVLNEVDKNWQINNNWHKYYRFHKGEHDGSHLGKLGFQLLAEKIYQLMNSKMILCPIIKNDNEEIKCLDVSIYVENKYIKRFKNSLIDINYLNIKNNIIISLNKPCKIIAINYLCDIESGIIVMSNKIETIEIDTLKDDPFILERKKSMFTLIHTNFKKESITYMILVKRSLKLVSIIVSNNVEIINIKIS